jgi:hypothetical protein
MRAFCIDSTSFYVAESIFACCEIVEYEHRLNDLARQKRKKMWPEWVVVSTDRRLTVRMKGSEFNLYHQIVQKFWQSNVRCGTKQKVFSVVSKPPYSQDLSPCNFLLFPKHKFHVTDQMRALPHEHFQHCYREWEQLLLRCVTSQENYIEEDNINIYFNR